jgi:hypothetical protein
VQQRDAALFTEPWTKETNHTSGLSVCGSFFMPARKETSVAERRNPIERRGVPCNFTFAPDALELLREMVPSRKGYGIYLSELLRNERVRQEERQKIKAAMAAEVERACG